MPGYDKRGARPTPTDGFPTFRVAPDCCTGLEDRAYQAGQPLDGQDGWIGLIGVDAAEVVEDHDLAASGRRAIRCWGGADLDIVHFPGFDLAAGAWDQPIDFDPITRPCTVRVEADIRLDGPDTGNGPNDDLLSANLYARNGAGRSAFLYLSSNGNAHAFANSASGQLGYQFETPIALGEYNHVAITLDYRTHIATFEVNGRTIGSLPFGGPGEQFLGTLIEFAAWDDPSFDRTQCTGYWDNLSVLAKPAR